MPEGPRASVIIPTHQRSEPLRRALASLSEQTAPQSAYEVVVAIDGSNDGTAEMLERFRGPFELRSVAGERRGRAAACNAAIEEARGEVLIVLDDDMSVVPEFVERHLRHHPAGSRLCVLGPVPVRLNGASPRAARHVQARFAAHLGRLSDPAHLNQPRSFYSGNASLRAEVMGEVGGFEEAFTAYGNEDVELALRLAAAGVELRYDPEAVAHQEYGKDLRGLAEDTLSKGKTTVLLARSKPGVFPQLRLAQVEEGGWASRAARALLLRMSRAWRAAPSAVFAAARRLEAVGLWRLPLFYRAVLGYAFWAGVDSALEESDDGELGGLAVELSRGPIDLLLHG